MQKLRPYHIEALYDTLSKTPCGQYVGGKRRDLSPKQQKRTLSGTTLHEVHQLLHNSFLLAVEWGILIKSPVPVEAPKKTTQECSIWEVDEMRAALDSMEDPILHLAVHLTLVGALREGEVAGLTPEDIDFDAANGMGTFTVTRSMQRVQKDTLAQVDKGCILRIFPDKLEGSKTSLILKDTKTEASCRTIFMTAALREELKQWLERLKREEALDPERYRNSGMLLRLPNGLAVEPVLIRKKFLKWQDAHPEFPRIVFHGLRHSSATYQLMISGGDIKAVQGTTGHASADMLVNTYAHIQQSSRVELGKKFESGFYAKPDALSPQAVPAAGEPTIKERLEQLEETKRELEARIAEEKLAKPKVTEEFIRFWLLRFRKLNMNQKDQRQALVDTFINSIYLYDDKVLITFNYKEGTQTITFEEAAQAASKENGSDLNCFTAPENAVKSKDFMAFLFCKPWVHGFCTVGVIHVR